MSEPVKLTRESLTEVINEAVARRVGVLVRGDSALPSALVPDRHVEIMLVCPVCRILGGHSLSCTDKEGLELKRITALVESVGKGKLVKVR